jgi:histidinol-phosphate/aromatic aminotransferase/cobyric acid decarboxylase-like protein
MPYGRCIDDAKHAARIDLSIRLKSKGRISVGLPEHSDRLVQALKEIGESRGS